MENNHIFEDIVEFPDPDARRRYAQLVGLDDVKDYIIKDARLLFNPDLLQAWSQQHHKCAIALLNHFRHRSPLLVFAGDVGTGKTSLAESFGDPVARQERISITLYRLSLTARGTGAVGEMTRLLSNAFKEIGEIAQKGKSESGKPASAVILLIDEADALAQSREFAQMHHEDRAGVNALIRGIDNLTVAKLPVIVVMCTNRLEALDPAVRRRAAATFEFMRPNEQQRASVLKGGLEGTNITDEQIIELAKATGREGNRTYGYTYSDLVQRLLPTLLLDAFPDRPIEFKRILEIIRIVPPTPPFKGDS
jgi:AAA+ superfamily predicted ATPase